MSQYLRITGGRIFDPANRVAGDVRTIFIADGKVVADLPQGASARTIDATGMVVMPGGIDMHCHIASPSVNTARAIMGEEHATHVHGATRCTNGCAMRGGTGRLTPSTFLTGYRYAALGYTSAIEAAVSPSGARQTHLQLDDTPNISAGFLLLLANHAKVIELLNAGDRQGAVAFVSTMLQRTGAYGIKVVNPGGVASWRHDAGQHTIDTIDDKVAGTRVTPRLLLQTMADAAEAMNLPHPPHVHCNRLGIPGNVQTTIDTLDALGGRRVRLTHLQFHAYGRSKTGDFTSAAPQLCDYLRRSPHVSVDVGQVMFGEAFTITADTPLEYMLWQLTGKRYLSIESELETGCGMMPFVYQDKHYLHSLQWAVGLELVLGSSDLWQIALSTDHPNGASFLSYPAVIAALMSHDVRVEQMKRGNQRAMRNCTLPEMTRELSLSEIAIITRAAPARMLGLPHKGHLGSGADADVTVYHDQPADPRQMFETPRYVIAGGKVLVEDGELREAARGERMRAAVSPNEHGDGLLREWFTEHGSYDVAQFGLREHELATMNAIPGTGIETTDEHR